MWKIKISDGKASTEQTLSCVTELEAENKLSTFADSYHANLKNANPKISPAIWKEPKKVWLRTFKPDKTIIIELIGSSE